MKHYTVTVNGTAYDVAVEETSGIQTAKPTAIQTERYVERVMENPQSVDNKSVVNKPVESEPVKQPAFNNQPISSLPAKVTITAPMPGKILDIKVKSGQEVKRGEVLFILEAMKMENEIVSPEDGTIAQIAISVGNNVESGDILATLN